MLYVFPTLRGIKVEAPNYDEAYEKALELTSPKKETIKTKKVTKPKKSKK